MKAMLLAAGRGERMRPLTDTVPKPLIKVGALNLIEYNIHALKAAGITEIVINVCYRAKDIIHYLGNGSHYGVNIEYSYEGDEPLDTGGGILRALTLLGDEPFWVVSADVWTQFNFRITSIPEVSDAHLILVSNPEFHKDGDFGLSEEGRLTRSVPKLTYGGIMLLHPQLFEGFEPGVFSIAPVLNAAITENKATGELYSGSWFNVGTEAELNKLRFFLEGSAATSWPAL